MTPSDIVKSFRIKTGRKFRLDDVSPSETLGFDIDKDEVKDLLASGVKRLRDLQEKLYADGKRSILIVLQAMDAAGKDSTIEHVMSGVNPQGCEVTSFKAPSSEELKHDFLWRTTVALPPRGHIGIFNRSYYEEVLVARVHPEVLARQNLPPEVVTKDIWQERFEDIRGFERHLVRNGTVILKFFLHLSKEEQRKRFLERIEDPDKHWKFSAGDIAERARWDEYMAAYDAMIRHTATKEAPWHVIPADNKWFSRLAVAATIVERLEQLDLSFPVLAPDMREAMLAAGQSLLEEGTAAAPPKRKTRKAGRASAQRQSGRNEQAVLNYRYW